MIISQPNAYGFLKLVSIVALAGMMLGFLGGCAELSKLIGEPGSRDFWERRERAAP